MSRTLLSILAVLNNAVLWTVSTRPPTSKYSSPFCHPLFTVPNAPITVGIIDACMFHSFFSSLAWSRYLSFFSHSFSFILWFVGIAKFVILKVFFVFLINWKLQHHKMRRALGWGQHRLLRIVSPSSCRHGPKPEINKPVRIWNESVRFYLYLYYYYTKSIQQYIYIYIYTL